MYVDPDNSAPLLASKVSHLGFLRAYMMPKLRYCKNFLIQSLIKSQRLRTASPAFSLPSPAALGRLLQRAIEMDFMR